MTTTELARAVRDRWYVAVAGLLLTAAAVVLVHDRPPVYETRVDIQVLPARDVVRTAVSNPDDDLVAVAGLVERMLPEDSVVAEPASKEVPLTGMGVRTGSFVLLPNTDGQFGASFVTPELRVRAVGATPAAASALRDARVREVTAVLEQVQTDHGVPRPLRLRTRLIPGQPTVEPVTGRPARAAAATALIGLTLTLMACTGFRLRRGRSNGASDPKLEGVST